MMVARGARLRQALLGARGSRADEGSPHDEAAQRRPCRWWQCLERRAERCAQRAVAMAQQLRERRGRWRLREALGREVYALELIERQAQPPGARIRGEREQQLDLAQAHPEGARLRRRRIRRGERHERGDHRGTPALAVSGELAPGVEGGAREVPDRGVHEARESGERRCPERREERGELACEGVGRASPCGAVAFLAPPREACVRHLVIEAGTKTHADLALERRECREYRPQYR